MPSVDASIEGVFPAHAGVIPKEECFGLERPCLPRACGGDPANTLSCAIPYSVFPAHAGVIPASYSTGDTDP